MNIQLTFLQFYAPREETAEVELKEVTRRFSINTWNNSSGLVEQGFTDLNTR